MKLSPAFYSLVAIGVFVAAWFVCADLGMAPADRDDMSYDSLRGHSTNRVGCGGARYTIYRANENIDTDRIVFRLQQPGIYKIRVSNSQTGEVLKDINATVTADHWFAPKVNVEEKLPANIHVYMSRQNLPGITAAGEWACDTGN